jgi:hypothetical protein
MAPPDTATEVGPVTDAFSLPPQDIVMTPASEIPVRKAKALVQVNIDYSSNRSLTLIVQPDSTSGKR